MKKTQAILKKDYIKPSRTSHSDLFCTTKLSLSDVHSNNNNYNLTSFIQGLWLADPSKGAKGLNMQPSPQKKGSARVTSMLSVTDNKTGLIPYSLRKGLQL